MLFLVSDLHDVLDEAFLPEVMSGSREEVVLHLDDDLRDAEGRVSFSRGQVVVVVNAVPEVLRLDGGPHEAGVGRLARRIEQSRPSALPTHLRDQRRQRQRRRRRALRHRRRSHELVRVAQDLGQTTYLNQNGRIF